MSGPSNCFDVPMPSWIRSRRAPRPRRTSCMHIWPRSAPVLRGVRSVWEQIAELDQVWEPWAALFAAGAPVRAAIETGRHRVLDPQQVARTEEAAAEFVGIVTDAVAAARSHTRPSVLAS